MFDFFKTQTAQLLPGPATDSCLCMAEECSSSLGFAALKHPEFGRSGCLHFNQVNLPAPGHVSGNGVAWCPLQLNSLCSSEG